MSEFRKIVENIIDKVNKKSLQEKKLSQQEINNYMQDVDDNDSNEEDEYNWEKEEEERSKRDEEIMKRPLHLTQADVENLLRPCIGMRSDSIYIPIKNNKGEIHIYYLDSDYAYDENSKPLEELSKKELLNVVFRNDHNYTPEELYWFVNTPGSYDEGYDVKEPSSSKDLLYAAKVLQNIENNE